MDDEEEYQGAKDEYDEANLRALLFLSALYISPSLLTVKEAVSFLRRLRSQRTRR